MPVPLRADFDAAHLRAAARKTKDAGARRLLALAAVYDGGTRTEAAKIGGVTLQIVRDWVIKLNAHGPDGLIDRNAPGQPSRADRHASRGAGRAAVGAAGPAHRFDLRGNAQASSAADLTPCARSRTMGMALRTMPLIVLRRAMGWNHWPSG